MADDEKERGNAMDDDEKKMSKVKERKNKKIQPHGYLDKMDIFRLYNEIQHVWYILIVDIRDAKDYSMSHIRRSMNIPYNTSMSNGQITSLIVEKKFRWATKILFYSNSDETSKNNDQFDKHIKKIISLIEANVESEKIAFEENHPTYHLLDCTYDYFFEKYAFLCYKNPLYFSKSKKNGDDSDDDNQDNNDIIDKPPAPGSAAKEDNEAAIFGDSYPNVVINDFLFLGDKYHAKDYKVMKYLGITHVLNCTKSVPNYFEQLNDDNALNRCVFYHRLDIDDADNMQVGWYLDDAMQFIDQALKHTWYVDIKGNEIRNEDERKDKTKCFKRRGKVLIHCAAGISRSSTVLIAYLMKMKQWRYDDTYNFVKERRDCVEPNEGFVKQLRLLDDMWFADKKSKNYQTDGLNIDDLTNAQPLYDMARGISRVDHGSNKSKKNSSNRIALWICDTCRLYNCIQDFKSNIVIDIRSNQLSPEHGNVYNLSHIARSIHIPMNDDSLTIFNKLKDSMTKSRIYKIIVYCDLDDVLHRSHSTDDFYIKHNEYDCIESTMTAATKRKNGKENGIISKRDIDDSDNYDNDNPTKLKYDANVEMRIKHILKIVNLIDDRTLMNKPNYYVYNRDFDFFYKKYAFLCYANKSLALTLHNEMLQSAASNANNASLNGSARYRPGSAYGAFNNDLSPIVELSHNNENGGYSPKPRLVVSRVEEELETLKSMQDAGNELSRKSQEMKENHGGNNNNNMHYRPQTNKNHRKMDFMVSPAPSSHQLSAGHHNPDFQVHRPLSPFSPIEATTPHSSITPMHGTPRPDTPIDDNDQPHTPTLSGEAMHSQIHNVQDQGKTQAPILNIPIHVSESVSKSNDDIDNIINEINKENENENKDNENENNNGNVHINIITDGNETDNEMPQIPSVSPYPTSENVVLGGGGLQGSAPATEDRERGKSAKSTSKSVSSGENESHVGSRGEEARSGRDSRSATPASPTLTGNTNNTYNTYNTNTNINNNNSNNNQNINLNINSNGSRNNNNNNNNSNNNNNNNHDKRGMSEEVTTDGESESGNNSPFAMTPPGVTPNPFSSEMNTMVAVSLGPSNNASNASNTTEQQEQQQEQQEQQQQRNSNKSAKIVNFAEVEQMPNKRRNSHTLTMSNTESASATETAATESVTNYSTLSRPHTATATQTAFTTDIENSVASIMQEWGNDIPQSDGKFGISLALQKPSASEPPVEKFEKVSFDILNENKNKEKDDSDGGLYNTSLIYPSQIIFESLYLGDGEQATNETIIKNLQITHILNVSDKIDNVFEKHNELKHIKYCKIKIYDGELVPIEKYFDKAIDFITESTNNNNSDECKDNPNKSNHGNNNKKRLLIHCQEGKSRSVTLLLAYLMKCKHMPYTIALAYVQDKKPDVGPNRGFKGKLKEFDKQLFPPC